MPENIITDRDIAFEIVSRFLGNPHPKQKANYEREKKAFAGGAIWMRQELSKNVKQLQAEKEELDKQAKTIRAGIMNYHDGKISFNQLMELQKDSTQEG